MGRLRPVVFSIIGLKDCVLALYPIWFRLLRWFQHQCYFPFQCRFQLWRQTLIFWTIIDCSLSFIIFSHCLLLLLFMMIKLGTRISRQAISIWTSVPPILDLMVAIERPSFKHPSAGPLLLLVHSVYTLYEQLSQVARRHSDTHNPFLLAIAILKLRLQLWRCLILWTFVTYRCLQWYFKKNCLKAHLFSLMLAFLERYLGDHHTSVSRHHRLLFPDDTQWDW